MNFQKVKEEYDSLFNGYIKPSKKVYSKVWRKKNAHKIKKYRKEYVEKNKDKIREYYKKYYAENKEKFKRSWDELKHYYYNNIEKIRAYRREHYKKNAKKILAQQKIYRERRKLLKSKNKTIDGEGEDTTSPF